MNTVTQLHQNYSFIDLPPKLEKAHAKKTKIQL